jgi:cellulose synthase/poly-beta-1,6-N-acetylglucosamine synthase-like glycosyltransferase
MKKIFSIIMISRSENLSTAALDELTRLTYGEREMEVFLACGQNPSLQRNEAAKRAIGDYLLFLDEDSFVHPQILFYYEDALSYEEGIGVVGGPSLFESEAGGFRSAVQAFLSSAFGLGPYRARYVSHGTVRRSTERELILCNLLISRELFQAESGFHLNLYPNEENEFLNRVREKTKIYYHPLAVCYRAPRATLLEHMTQMFRYGQGRAKHLLLFPQFWDHIFFLPLLFSVYLLFLLFLLYSSSPNLFFYGLPFIFYFLLALGASAYAALNRKKLPLIAYLPPLFLGSHFMYGAGFLYGILHTPWASHRAQGEVVIHHLKQSGEPWNKSALSPT